MSNPLQRQLSNHSQSPGSGTPLLPASSTPPPSLPIPPSQSLLLSQLPQPTHQALQQTLSPPVTKVTILFKPLPSAPHLSQSKYQAPSDWRFDKVVTFLRKKLGLGRDARGLFCYINSKFSPAGDEVVGNLFECFKVDEQLVVSYCLSEAFG